ncbi:MFS transporter [Sphingorhabdus lutea]|uniref:MFS transporter n=2 Tax=Sphingorhabdus lutea TaxID=1913578 RepID=A0A1L3JEM5_9SPHN|nr:MFS transporter [Sphingorhabdus lutea]
MTTQDEKAENHLPPHFTPPGKLYSSYILLLLVLIYAFNFLDRQIITILAPSLKEDLGVTDAQLGLLFGTAFALFYALFGIPLAKLADGWSRVRTISWGLSFWSGMTAVSGFAGNFVQLALARVGVGIGEASASPAAYSLLQDYFPKEKRATALSIYSSGIYVGVGASLIFGGAVIDYWANNYTPETQPFGLAGWQATFLAFGIPGLILALLMRFTVKEPPRGFFDGIEGKNDPHPFRAVFREMGGMFPPFSMIRSAKAGGKIFRNNAIMAMFALILIIALVSWTDNLLAAEKRAIIANFGSFALTTNMVQWTAIGIGLYCSYSWLQSIRLRDKPTAQLIGNISFAKLALIGGIASFASYGVSPFIFLFAKTEYGVGPSAGLTLGWILAVSGGLGTVAGGMISDHAKKFHAAGRIYVVMIALALAAIFTWLQLTATDATTFYIFLGLSNFCQIMWLAPIAASSQDIVLPRMRGTATAVFFLGTNLIGLGMGPYVIGLISDIVGDLQTALLCVLICYPVVIIMLLSLIKPLPKLEQSVVERAREAGEPI